MVVSLFLAGHVSDRFGRRRIMAPAIVLNVMAALMFMVWPELPGLLTARFFSGLGIGMLTATATAYLTELHGAARPGFPPRRAEVVSTAANIGGLGLGPLVTGFLAEFGPAPLYTPYVVFAFLLLGGLLLMVAVPETVKNVEETWTYRPQRVAVPRSALGKYVAAAMLAFLGFAMFGFFTSLAPSFVSEQLGIASHVVAGFVVFLAFASSAVFQVFSSRWKRRSQFIAGPALQVAGIASVTVALAGSSLPLLLLGGVVAGAGAGVAFKSAIGTVIDIAPPESRGEALAGLFLAGYIGMAFPVLLLGLAMQVLPLVASAVVFGSVMLLLASLTVVLLLRAFASRPERAPRVPFRPRP